MKRRQIVAALVSVVLFGILPILVAVVVVNEKRVYPPNGFCTGDVPWEIYLQAKLVNPRCLTTGEYVLDVDGGWKHYNTSFAEAERIRHGRCCVTYRFEPDTASTDPSSGIIDVWEPRYEWVRVLIACLFAVAITGLIFGVDHLILWLWSNW